MYLRSGPYRRLEAHALHPTQQNPVTSSGAYPLPTVEISSATATLVGIDDRSTYTLTESDTFLGRAIDNDVVLASDLSLSRRHAVITKIDGVYYLRDLRSSNGTLLNGLAVEGMTALNVDDEIYLGRTRFLFSPTVQKLHATPPFGHDADTTTLSATSSYRLQSIWRRLTISFRKFFNPHLKATSQPTRDLTKLKNFHREELLKAVQR